MKNSDLYEKSNNLYNRQDLGIELEFDNLYKTNQSPGMQKLSPRQSQVLRMLGRGMTYQEIKDELKISLPSVHMICWKIRKATGIKSTKDRDQCRMTRIELSTNPEPNKPTPAQRRILHMVANGMTYKEISEATGLRSQTIQDHVCAGCKRLGITRRGAERLTQLRAALGLNVHMVTMDDPFFN